MKTLVVDVGGTNVKVLATGKRTPIKIPSGTHMTPRRMVAEVMQTTADWDYDRVSIGFPGPVKDEHPLHEPWNLGRGWVGFNFKRAFKKPVRILNDAAMQALGSYDGGKMLFLGLGTGLGSTMICEGTLIPLELAHLPYRDDESYEAWVGNAGMHELGKKQWRKHVLEIIDLFVAALEVEYVVLGGGNARHMKNLPRYVRLGSNANAFKGGYRMWER